MDVFSALAEPNRRRIMEMLASKGQLSASDISQRFAVSPPAISQHLKVLRDAGWIEGVVEGPAVNYHLCEETIQWFRSIVKHIF